MRTWRGACAAAALVVLLGACAGNDEPAAIDGRVDIVPADDAKRLADKLDTAEADAGERGLGSSDDFLKGDDPTSDRPKPSRSECASSVAASNALLTKHVLALFPPKKLRQVEKMTPADTEQCDPREGPDFGGLSALWKGMTGAQAIDLLEKEGWTRSDPAQGPPAWASQKLPPGNGDLNLEPDPKFVVTFTAQRGGKKMWIDLTQDGMRAGID